MRLLSILLLLFMCGCMTTPDRTAFEFEECYNLSMCLYANKDNPDKSICKAIADECCYAMQEKRRKERLEYCANTCPEGMSQSECRLWFNQR